MSYDWIVEGLTQFVKSPLWTQPIQDFIDDNCVIFGEADTKENGAISTSLFSASNPQESSSNSASDLSPELIVIHKQFAEIVDSVLTGYLEELGVDAAKALEVLQASKNPEAANIMKYLLSLDDFPTFKTIMVRRNHELELEALRAIERKIEKQREDAEKKKEEELIRQKNAALNLPQQDTTSKKNVDDEEDDDIRAAIALSLAEVEALKLKEAEMEDAELREALALSRAMEDERLAALRAEQQAILDAIEQSKRDAAAKDAAAKAAQEKLEAERRAAQAKAEEEYRLAKERAAQVAKEAAEKRAAIADRVSDILIARETKTGAATQLAQAPPRPVEQPTTTTTTTVLPTPTPTPVVVVEQQPKKEEPTTPVVQEVAKPQPTTPVVVSNNTNNTNNNTLPAIGGTSTSTTSSSLPPLGGLPPVGLTTIGSASHTGSFSVFSKLPSKKATETQDESLSSLVAASLTKKKAEAPVTPTAEPPAVAKKELDAEELERRAAYLRQQRDAIIAKRKAEREAEMNRFSGGKTSAPAASSGEKENKPDSHTSGGTGKAVDSVHAQLTQELARRFKPTS